jgi:hypothetical protein
METKDCLLQTTDDLHDRDMMVIDHNRSSTFEGEWDGARDVAQVVSMCSLG